MSNLLPSGLSTPEAAARLAADGPNTLPPPARPRAWRRLAGELFHFFALMLWVAGGLALLAGMPQLGIAIFVVIVVNGVFAFVQEQRAERAAEELQALIPDAVTVRRDGQELRVGAADLVVGDVVMLSAGDRIPADVELLLADDLSVDESMLTGESVTVPLARDSKAWAGTYVVNGDGAGSVTATGAHTRLAGIAKLTGEVHPPKSPLSAELDRIVRTIAAISVIVGLGFFGIALLVGTPAKDGFLFAVGVTVALVPEGLLPTVTLSLAMGAQRMAKEHALVRHLEAVETLGSTTFICTDKTGTLTRNEMNVVEVWTPSGTVKIKGIGYAPAADLVGTTGARRAASLVAGAARTCSKGRAVERDGVWTPAGDPMEAAIDALARRLDAVVEVETRIHHSFDTERRRESVLTDDWLFVKGAPDAVIPLVVNPEGADAVVEAMAARGLRVLAVARCVAAEVRPDASPVEAEQHLELLGAIGLQDPPRPEVARALIACRVAGIRVAMLTGDHPTTAKAIAREIGLLGKDELVVEGADLPADEEVLGALLDRDGVVVSRVTPEDKLRIARSLQRRGHVVAMTGDGVNDGPALQTADIGIAMGRSGTDVARAAADLVLLDDNFATIVAAIEQGRATFSNIRRFLTYHLTDNVAELTPFVIWALSGGRFPLALGVLQILCLDIGTDLLPALALGGESAAPDVLKRPPERRHLIDRILLRRVFGVLGPTEAVVEIAAFLAVFLAAGWRPGDSFPGGHVLAQASGAAFMAVVVGQAANAFACRSASRPPWKLGWRTNRLLLGAVAVEMLALASFLLIAPVERLLDHAQPGWVGAGVALLAAPAVLGADALHKAHRSRNRARHLIPGLTRPPFRP